jgi:hypothetical protein
MWNLFSNAAGRVKNIFKHENKEIRLESKAAKLCKEAYSEFNKVWQLYAQFLPPNPLALPPDWNSFALSVQVNHSDVETGLCQIREKLKAISALNEAVLKDAYNENPALSSSNSLSKARKLNQAAVEKADEIYKFLNGDSRPITQVNILITNERTRILKKFEYGHTVIGCIRTQMYSLRQCFPELYKLCSETIKFEKEAQQAAKVAYNYA